MTQSPARIKANKDGQAILELGPMETVYDCEGAVRTITRALAAGKDPTGTLTRALIGVRTLLWSKFQTKGLEIKGLNMDGSAPEVKVTLTDYATTHEQLQEENAALRAQVEQLMQGRERPRPPRPQMN